MKFKRSIRLREKCEFNEYKEDRVVIARLAGLNISKTADRLDFHPQQSLEFKPQSHITVSHGDCA